MCPTNSISTSPAQTPVLSFESEEPLLTVGGGIDYLRSDWLANSELEIQRQRHGILVSLTKRQAQNDGHTSILFIF